MTDPTPLRADDPRALAVTIAIETGDVASLRRLLEAQPQIVHTWIAKKDGGPRTPVFIAVDWPGTSRTSRRRSPLSPRPAQT